MDLGLKNKVAIVTGAGSQIGFGHTITLTLANEGCDIVATDVDLEGAKKTAAEIKALGREVIAVKADITNRAEVDAMVSAALKKFSKVDILVNCAGATNKPTPFTDIPVEWWDADININLQGAMNCTKAVINHMTKRKYGKIVSISSAVGRMGMSYCAVYGAAKAGVIGFTRGLAVEVAPMGINVNCIAPGPADTGFGIRSQVSHQDLEHMAGTLPARRLTTPQDIANTVAFLVSDVSSDIVGQTISVDGGMVVC
jgi:2-hydroxycyclohexanecarboxyl-CoA dehydrogenase